MPYRVLKQRRAIVTGASSGIGRAISCELVERGVNVVLVARRADRLEELQATLAEKPGKIQIVVGDVRDPQTRQRAVSLACECWGGLDILVNNAGFGKIEGFSEGKPEDLAELVGVNFVALAEMTRTALPELRQGVQPLVVNIGSVLGHFALPRMAAYSASKFAVRGFSDALRGELRGEVEILLASPATTKSEFFDQMQDAAAESKWRPANPPSAEWVASKIIQAMIAGKREVYPTWSAWWLCTLNQLCPRMFQAIVNRS